MVDRHSQGSAGCVAVTVCLFHLSNQPAYTILTSMNPVNHDDFMSRYNLLRYGREQVLEGI